MSMESTLEHTLKVMKQEWQADILKDFRNAVVAELSGDERDAMLRQITDIARTRGITI